MKTNPRFNERVWSFPSDFVKSGLHCFEKKESGYTLESKVKSGYACHYETDFYSFRSEKGYPNSNGTDKTATGQLLFS